MRVEENNNKKIFIIIGVIILVLGISFGIYVAVKDNFLLEERPDKYDEEIGELEESDLEKKVEYEDNTLDFNVNLIKSVNKLDYKNYLISPYSIEIALNLLKSGADGNTYKELESVVPDRNIYNLNSDNIKVANGAFIKDTYKNLVEASYINKLKTNYDAEIIYDKFTTPDIINNYVKEKTNGMIEKILENMDPNFVLGLINALAIDVEWNNKFECENTESEEFTKDNNQKINVEMMHQGYSDNITSYFEDTEAKGVIIPYKDYNGKRLEFVGILPNNNIDSYINSLTTEKLNNIKGTVTSSSENKIYVSIPRFTYDFDLGITKPNEFINVLKNMGITEVFDQNKANLDKIIKKENQKENLYVGDAIHKTHIEFSETGTKAAAVTYIDVIGKNMIIKENNIYKIEFNKPFIYIIRDSKTKEILFFGNVNEPNLWKSSTCSSEEN